MRTRITSSIVGIVVATFVSAFPAPAKAATPGDGQKPAAVTFTTCGQTGRYGPTAEQCLSAYAGTALLKEGSGFDVVDGYQYWLVPSTGNYDITIAGAKSSPGRGAKFSTTIRLTGGTRIKIVVGQQGSCDNKGGGCGGGGGTFLATADNQPLAVAGGGGARGYMYSDWNYGTGCDETDGRFETRGGQSRDGWAPCNGYYNGNYGSNGNGGGAWWCGSGGAGFYGDGSACRDEFVARSFTTGAVGGGSLQGCADGGFGGGGGSYGCEGDSPVGSAGGGGGYSGGGGAERGYSCWYYCRPRYSGGGGSWSSQGWRSFDYNSGQGFLQISAVEASTIASPRNVTAAQAGLTSAVLTWDDGVGASDWDVATTFNVQGSVDGGNTWLDLATVPRSANPLTLDHLRCGERYTFRLRGSRSGFETGWVTSGEILLGATNPTVCPAWPTVTIPGRQVTVAMVGLTPKVTDTGTGYVLATVNGATVQVVVNADGVAKFTYTPTAAGKGVVKAQLSTVNKKTYRVTNYRFQGPVWTANIRLPRAAVAGRSVNVNVGNIPSGEILTVTTSTGDAIGVANSSGNVVVPVTFGVSGLADISVSYRGTVLASGTVTVTAKK